MLIVALVAIYGRARDARDPVPVNELAAG